MLARTTSPSETRALAAAVAALLRPGDVLLLSGEMGAGKTAFTQGLGAGLGIEARITSPTFTIAQTYEGGRLLVHHLDAYRLEHLHEALDAGLAEMVDDDGVVVIEWGDALAPLLPATYLEIRITFGPGVRPGPDDDLPAGLDLDDPAGLDLDDPAGLDVEVRNWHLRPLGPPWAARVPALRAAVAPWKVDAC